jgi:hypothetical protein
MKRKLHRAILHLWRTSAIYIGIAVVIGSLLLYRLGTLVPGFSQPELAARASASSGKLIVHNPMYLPHKLVQYVFILLGRNGAFWMRLPSALFAVVIIVGFYRIIRTWYSVRVAMLATFLFLSSAWFLHYGRLGTPQILLGSSIGLLWMGIRLRANQPRTSTIIISSAIVVTCLYIPGLIWFIVPLLIWQRKKILQEVSRLSAPIIALVILASIVAVGPLIYAFVRDVSLIRVWLALPDSINILRFLSNLWHIPVWLAIRGPNNPNYWLGHVPFLDIFSVVMLILGIYYASHYLLLDRVRTIIGMLLIGVFLTVLNGPWMLFVIAPVIFVVIASGIALLLQQWFTVFPRNHLARWLGIGMVTGIVLLASVYNVRHYFVAWARSPETHQTFNLQR